MSVPSSSLSQEEGVLTLEEGLWLFLDDREPVSPQITADIHTSPPPTAISPVGTNVAPGWGSFR